MSAPAAGPWAATTTRAAHPITFHAALLPAPMPDISGIPAYHRIDDHEGFSLHEGFSFNKRKILRDHVRPSCPPTARSREATGAELRD
jgi:hypothetical protein